MSTNVPVNLVYTAVVTTNEAYAGQTLQNTAQFAHSSGNGSAQASFTVQNVSNLGGSWKSASATGKVLPGSLVTYIVTLSNSGGLNTTARITDVLGSYYTVYNAMGFSQPTTGTLTWSGVVTAGQSVTLHFVVQVVGLTKLPLGTTTLNNSVQIDDGMHTPFTVNAPTPPWVEVYGIYLPCIAKN